MPVLGQSSTRETVTSRFDNSRMIHLVDTVTGNFRKANFYQALKQANTDAAIVVQEGMAARLRQNIGIREQRPGERLANALTDRRNREVFANTFSVGLTHWLDRSPAKLYYRRIEEGDTATFTARILFTNNGDLSGPYSKPGDGTGHMRMRQFNPSGTRGVLTSGIGPFPALRYVAGGREAFAVLDMKALYAKALHAAGVDISKGVFR